MNDEIMKNKKIGSRIRAARIEKGLSADELAAKIYKSRATIYRWEDGLVGGVSYMDFQMLCEALGTSFSYIMGLSPDLEAFSNQAPALSEERAQRLIQLLEKEEPEEPQSDVDIIIERSQNLPIDALKRLSAYYDALIKLRET